MKVEVGQRVRLLPIDIVYEEHNKAAKDVGIADDMEKYFGTEVVVSGLETVTGGYECFCVEGDEMKWYFAIEWLEDLDEADESANPSFPIANLFN